MESDVSRSTSRVAPLLVLALVCSAPDMAYGAIFNVDHAADTVDTNPGDGICDDGGGKCTLRAAIIEANATADSDVIDLAPDVYTLSLPGTNEDGALTGDLDITANLTIVGTWNTIIDGGGMDRVFDIHASAVFAIIIGVTIRNGASPSNGGAILNRASLALDSVTLTGNQAAGRGGGLYDLHGASVLRSRIVRNEAGIDGGGLYSALGGIGIQLSDIRLNRAARDGGGVAGANYIAVVRSALIGNSAGRNGGGIHTRGKLALWTSTVSQNGASGTGGGIYKAGAAIMDIEDSTISHNAAVRGAGGLHHEDERFSEVLLVNTILAKNNGPLGPDCSGTLDLQGHNLLGSTVGCNVAVSPSDLVAVDPLLGPLLNNGGPTANRALLPGSPAINTGRNTCRSPDQRGVQRPQGVACDMGAYEVEVERRRDLPD